MLDEFPIEIRILLCVLAIWRLSHFFAAEDGPGGIVVKIRARLGDSLFGTLMDCFYCLSIWIAVPFAFLIGTTMISWIVCWLALSGGTSLLEKATTFKKEGH